MISILDPQLQQTIDKVASFVAGRALDGPAFEATLREKERSNPAFSFLTPGAPYSDYYQWKLAQIRARPAQEERPSTLSTSGAEAITNMLSNLSGSHHSIADGRAMLMDSQFEGHEGSVAQLVRQHFEKEPNSQKRVFILYLISDVLHGWYDSL